MDRRSVAPLFFMTSVRRMVCVIKKLYLSWNVTYHIFNIKKEQQQKFYQNIIYFMPELFYFNSV